MNIFILDQSPFKAAQMQCDKHVVKMIVESAQMLSTAHRILDGTPSEYYKNGNPKAFSLPDDRDTLVYRASHVNHPSNIWCRETTANYNWLYNHFVALLAEYTYRYGKTHKCEQLVDVLATSPNNIRSAELTPFAIAIKSAPGCMEGDKAVIAYRQYYREDKAEFAKWEKGRAAPEWW